MSGITCGQWLISPLFHEGAQNLRATPPCAELILPLDFDPQAGETNTMGRITPSLALMTPMSNLPRRRVPMTGEE
jgi:hypothetical protein